MTLSVVQDEEEELRSPHSSHYDEVTAEFVADRVEMCPKAPYEFEGEEVKTTSAKLTSVADLNIGDRLLKKEDMVVMEVIGRVVGVYVKDDDKHNCVTRVHTIKAIDVEFKRAYSPAGGVEYR